MSEMIQRRNSDLETTQNPEIGNKKKVKSVHGLQLGIETESNPEKHNPTENTNRLAVSMLNCFLLALKRFARPSSILLLIVIFLTVVGGKMAGHQASLRPCGVVLEDDHECSTEVLDFLKEKGFIQYDDRSSMEADISNGKLDCGAVLLSGLGKAVMNNAYEGTVALLVAPDSFLTEAYEAHITAALFRAAAPGMIEKAARDSGVTLEMEDIRAEWDRLHEAGYLFTFTVVSTEGRAPLEEDYGSAIALAAAALLLFAAIVPGTRRLVETMDGLWARVGRKNALGRILVPGLLVQLILFGLAALGLEGEALAALPGYVLALTALGLILARIPMQLKPLVPLVLLGSLAMLPMYFDLAASYPQLMFLRYVLPPCWLLLMTQAPLWSGIAALVVLGVVLGFYPQKRVK